MLSRIFWRNAALLCRVQWRDAVRVEACHMKQFCALNNNDTSLENFGSLAVSAGKEDNVDSLGESELVYFDHEHSKAPQADSLGESELVYFDHEPSKAPQADSLGESELVYFDHELSKASQESPQVIYKKKSLKPTLFYTNKALFGPLLETSAQKKKRYKSEDESDGEQKQKIKKKKKPKKQKPALMQPLISKPENAYLLGVFPGEDSKAGNKFHYHKAKLDPQQGIASFSDSRNITPLSKPKILVFKKLGYNPAKYDHLVFKDDPKTRIIQVSSWNDGKEVCVPSTTDDGSAGGCEPVRGEDSQAESNAAENRSVNTTHLPGSSSHVQTGKDQEIENTDITALQQQQQQNISGNSSLLSVDIGKFTLVPDVIDIEMMTNFPLEKPEPSSVLGQTSVSTDDNILTIGMFDGGYQRLPSVSKILEATMPEDARRILERWKAKMIKQLGEEGFEQYRQGLFEKGKLLHGCIQSELSGISPSVETMPTVQGVWTSISHVLPKISKVSVLESRLVHPYLYYQGAVDCVAAYKGMPVLIDWKTSTKPKLTLQSMFDNPLQVAAYLGAFNYDHSYQFPHQVQSAMLVVAYDTGLPAHVHIIDREKCQAYWRAWCARLVQFWRQLEVKESV